MGDAMVVYVSNPQAVAQLIEQAAASIAK